MCPQCDSERPDSRVAGNQHKEKKHSTAVPGSVPTLGTRPWIPGLAIGGMFTVQMGTFPFPAESIFPAYDCLMY